MKATLLIGAMGLIAAAQAFAGTGFEWQNDHGYVYCAAVTSDGTPVKQVIEAYCIGAQGVYYDWAEDNGYVYCAQKTRPDGWVIKTVSDSYCYGG